MRKVTSRKLGIIERALVLGLCSLNGVPGPDEATLDALRVVGGCGCGCASIDFEANAPGGEPYAEGYGTTADGIPVGLILWERDKRFTKNFANNNRVSRNRGNKYFLGEVVFSIFN